MTKLKYIVTLVIVLLFFSCKKKETIATDYPCSFADSSYKHPKHVELSNLINNYVKKGLPGVSVIINDASGTWVGAAGMADIEKGVKFTPCHVSKIASITKMILATLTMKLYEQGRIDINSTTDDYIDADILNKISNAKGQTMKNLMNHTTGIPDIIYTPEFYLEVMNNPNKNWTQTELLKFIYNKPAVALNSPYPAAYSNSNAILLSMCIEKATGEKHETLLRKLIFEPLGMNDTYYQGREPLPHDIAKGYFDIHSNNTIADVTNIITGSGNGFTGIYSNLFDLQKFTDALFIKKTLLSQQSLNEMQQFNQESENQYCGLGLIKKYTEKNYYGIGHTGKDLGYTANLFYFPQKQITMIFLINYGTNIPSNLRPVFLDFENELVDLISN